VRLLGSHKCLALRTRSLNDQERNIFARARRVKREVEAGRWATLFALLPRDWPTARLHALCPLMVRLTRCAPGQPLDPTDNLPGSLKGFIDGVARQLGIDDGDVARLRFECRQERGPWGVLVEIFGEAKCG
jgi:hypothetical protein